MKALITGSDGLIGRYTHAELNRRDCDITAIDTKGLVDARDWFRAVDTRYDLVVHCAAHVGGRRDIEGRPLYLASVNLQLDGALFEWALRTRPAHVVYWSSSAAYPVALQGPTLESWSVENGTVTTQPGARPLRETDIDLDRPQLPDASYGAVKLMGEQLARWAQTEGVKVYVLRPFSGYAADQDHHYPMRAFLDRVRRRADPFDVWGTGQQVRDWIHVEDVVAGALAAVEQDHAGPLNLCSGHGVSFDELASMLCQQAGYTPEIRRHPDKPQGVHYRVGDPTEMARVYQPRIPLEQAIKQALAG